MEHLTQLRQTRPWTAVHGDGPHNRDLGVADRERARRGAYRPHTGQGEVYPDLCIPSCLHDEDVRVLAIQEADVRAQAKLTISTITISGTVSTRCSVAAITSTYPMSPYSSWIAERREAWMSRAVMGWNL